MDLITGVGVVVVVLQAVRLGVLLGIRTVRDVRAAWRELKREGEV